VVVYFRQFQFHTALSIIGTGYIQNYMVSGASKDLRRRKIGTL
jgi:hypothetical protein